MVALVSVSTSSTSVATYVSGSISSESVATSEQQLGVGLESAVSSQAIAEADTLLVHGVSAAATGSAISTATISTVSSVSGTAVGECTVSSSMSIAGDKVLSAETVGSSVTSASLSLSSDLSGQISGETIIIAGAEKVILLSGSVSSEGVTSARLIVPIVGNVVSSALSSAAISLDFAESARIFLDSVISSSLDVTVRLVPALKDSVSQGAISDKDPRISATDTQISRPASDKIGGTHASDNLWGDG